MKLAATVTASSSLIPVLECFQCEGKVAVQEARLTGTRDDEAVTVATNLYKINYIYLI